MNIYHPTEHSELIVVRATTEEPTRGQTVTEFRCGMRITLLDVPPGYADDHMFTVLETDPGGHLAFILPRMANEKTLGVTSPSRKAMWVVTRDNAFFVDEIDIPTI